MQLLLRQPQPPVELLPFLVLRTADWAEPLRNRARAALAVLLHEHPKSLGPAAAPLTLLIVVRSPHLPRQIGFVQGSVVEHRRGRRPDAARVGADLDVVLTLGDLGDLTDNE